MKRRKFLIFTLSGLGLGAIAHRAPLNAQVTQTPPLLSFVALGDVGTGERGQYAIARAMNRYFSHSPFSLVLLTGDNIYTSGKIARINEVFERPYRFLRQQGIPFYAVLGNHDVQTNNGDDQVRYPGFNMQERYYTFTKGPVQFFALDTTTNNWQEQQTWLEDSLARSPAPWKIVFGHHPVFSSGMHGSTPRLLELSSLFSRYGAQFYLCGHDHNYERIEPRQGTSYLVCGAGASYRPVDKSDWTACAESILSFAAFDVYQDRLEVKGIDRHGQVFDRAQYPLLVHR